MMFLPRVYTCVVFIIIEFEASTMLSKRSIPTLLS
jgi:hypothetical protein